MNCVSQWVLQLIDKVKKDDEHFYRNNEICKNGISMCGGKITNKNMDKKVSQFAEYGTTYELKAFAKYYDDSINSVKAETVDNKHVDGKEMTVGGQPVKSLNAEVVSALVIKDGKVTTGSAKPATSGDVTYADPYKTNYEKNQAGVYIHIHPYRAITIKLQDRSTITNVEIGRGPSPDDHNVATPSSTGWTNRWVVVDSKVIYLINSNSDQTIYLNKNVK